MKSETERAFVRRNIIGIARAFRRDGAMVPDPKTDPLDQPYKRGSDEAIAVWNAHKVERNALIAVIGDRAINRAITDRDQFPPYGLVKSPYVANPVDELPSYPYFALDKAMSVTLQRALDIEISEIERLARGKSRIRLFVEDKLQHLQKLGSASSSTMETHEEAPDPIIGVYRRLDKIIKFGDAYLPEVPNRVSPTRSTKQFITRGNGQAAAIMTAALEVIPKVYETTFSKQSQDPQELLAIARNSYQLIVAFAAQHLVVFGLIRDRVGYGGELIFEHYILHQDSFELQQTPNGLRLIIKDEIKKSLEYQSNHLQDVLSDDLEITGCPALVSFDNGSAIKKLWDWHIEIAEKIYGRRYSTQQTANSTTSV